MLIHLQISNFAIAEQLELDFKPGMSVITGETGAGKSIMIDALGLLLGDRADSAAVRHGSDRTEISAVFDPGDLPMARAWLAERDLDAEHEVHLRRIISRNGRSRAYINGSLQPLQLLKEFGEYLVDIHGQHAHQSLLKHEVQRLLLDDYAGHQALLAEVGACYQRLNQLQRRLEALQQASNERDARLDLLRYQVQELQSLDLQADEPQALEQEQRLLANAERILETCQQALGRLYENEELSVHALLTRTLRELDTLAGLDKAVASFVEMLNAALIQLEEASDELRHYSQQVELDPARLEWVEQRLADVDKLARKHRVDPLALSGLAEKLQAELDEIDNSELHRQKLAQELEQAERDYTRCARELSARRAETATLFSQGVGAAMQGLGMPNGQFEVQVERHDKPSPTGLDSVDFLVSANPGQPLKPLGRVASGGELSRISLAIQVIAARDARIPTLIFDEVDTGVGGSVAEVVGKQLQTLGNTHQVLCVTHLPQVAAQADQHFQINKQTDGQTTQTSVALLDEQQRVAEIARMLGGLAVTDNTVAHAREMIEHARRQTALAQEVR